MAEIKWTDEQLDAIEASGGTVLVSAAAGSGKTAVLVKRVIEKITDEKKPCSVDELLIVTFTKAAASQMKDKISAAIYEMVSRETDVKKRSYLLKQQMLLKCAKISTIDSFCSDIVRNNIQATDLDSDYKLLDKAAMDTIKDMVYEEVAEEFYQEGNQDFLVLADMFTKSNDDKALKDLVFSLYDFSRSYRNPEKWLEEIDRRLHCEETDFTNPYAVTVADSFREDMLYCRMLAQKACEILAEEPNVESAYGAAFSNDIEFFDNILEYLPEKFTCEQWDKVIEVTPAKPFCAIGRLKAEFKCAQADAVKTIRDNYKNIYEKSRSVIGVSYADNRYDVEKSAPVIKMLSRFTIAFFERFRQAKIEKNCADFDDVLHIALDLLIREENGKIEKTDLAWEYTNQFKEILIDEYQDTNEAQDVLFEAVSRGGENLFFVGDVKQSIYGFRKAMPQIFLKKRKEFADYNRDNPVFPATITLDRNFRSRKQITDFVNYTFLNLMSEEVGEINYNERETLKAGGKFDETDEVSCEFHVLEKTAFEETDRATAQAVHVANEIKKILEKGRFKLNDIAILLRKNKSIPLFVQVLNDMGINAYADESENLFETKEVRTVFSLIKVIDNPIRDVPLLAAMMSPIFGFTADELTSIRINHKSGSFYSAVKAASENGDARCSAFLDELSSYRLISQTMSPGELVRYILDKTGYKAMVSSLERGARRKENLDIFRNFAENFSKENDIALSGFVRQVEKIEKSAEIKASSDSSGNENAVAIMSIHRSKGLEFPVCFVAEAEDEFSRRWQNNDLLAHQQSGVGVIGIDPKRMIKYETLSRTAIKIEKEKTDLSENMRVLYVALTRAKEKLIIVGAPKDFSKTLAKASVSAFGEKALPVGVRKASSYLEWLTSVVLRHPDAVDLRLKAGGMNISKIKADFPLEVKIIKELPAFEEEKGENINLQETDENYLEKIKEVTSYQYEYAPLSGVLAKRGASTAFKETVNREFFASDRPAFLSKTTLTAAGRGTAMHLFMQFSDYAQAKDNLEAEIERLQGRGFITDVQAKSLDRKKLKVFFESDLYERISSAEKVYREKKFIIGMSPREFDENLPERFDSENVIVQGILDCAFEENGEIVIIDYKTDRVSDPDQLRERYSGQLKIYEKAVRECLGKNVKETLLYSFSLETTVKI
ncbi:MAG: helicase-exonuclease AddAB subunit AddA [Ruminococcaceae bacterium]|nr:helicase-exonuclease AddAB subunit AddA [Oscillospiraceae bacterium]